ncbi:MAG: thioredoxin [Candidatus Ozemobacteraceae bacterium]
MSLELDKSNFSKEVNAAKIPVLVDFWAPWCGPCRVVGPTIDAISREFEGRIKVAKVNVDNNPDLAERFGVMSIPTLAFFKGGKLVKVEVGAMSKNDLAKKIEIYLLAAR